MLNTLFMTCRPVLGRPKIALDSSRQSSAVFCRILALFNVGVCCHLFGCNSPPPVGYVPPVMPAYDGPAVEDRAIWRPFFETDDVGPGTLGDVRATAFAVELGEPGRVFFVTAAHAVEGALDPIRDPSVAAETRGSIVTVRLTDAFGVDNSLYKSNGVVVTPKQSDSIAGHFATWSNSVILLDAGAAKRKTRPLTVSQQPVALDDTVWLSTAVFGGASASVVGHAARVTAIQDAGTFTYRFDNARLSLKAADGAPLLNDEGDVVGMHLVDKTIDSAIIGVGVTSEHFRLGTSNETSSAEASVSSAG